ncbi:putative salivary secreted peptide [Megalopta genalis]|uniref:putative salivary secreted peptide n=1 Tax=Megalopta genalis TaxID=115081 RepID=UPI003FD17F4A
MSALKLTVCLATAMLALVANQVGSAPFYENYVGNNGTIGRRVPGDVLIAREYIVTDERRALDTKFAMQLNVTEWEKITLVSLINNIVNSNASFRSTLTHNGKTVDYTFALKGPVGQITNMTIEIYALPDFCTFN